MSVDRPVCIEVCCDTCADMYRVDGVEYLTRQEAIREARAAGWRVCRNGSVTCPECRDKEEQHAND